jgi:hypothetical protein
MRRVERTEKEGEVGEKLASHDGSEGTILNILGQTRSSLSIEMSFSLEYLRVM